MEDRETPRKKSRAEKMEARSRRLNEGLTYMWNWYEVPVAWRHDPRPSDYTFRRSEAGYDMVVSQVFVSKRWKYRVMLNGETVWNKERCLEGTEGRPEIAMSKADELLGRLLDGHE
jgi:hypothetical protein